MFNAILCCRRHYHKSFDRILLARDFSGKRVCIKNLVFMPKPVILFIWDGWWTDMACSFVGPSSLFQRWNLHIRHNYGLLGNASKLASVVQPQTSGKFRVLLILRRMNSWRLKAGLGTKDMNMMTSRLMANEVDVISTLQGLSFVDLAAIDLSDYSFEQQMQLMASSHIVIGAHGAGMAATMHMPVGTAQCCGVIEIFPKGQFLPIRGYGNMARRVGHYYERIEVYDSVGQKGMKIDTNALTETLKKIVDSIKKRPTCVHPDVLTNPVFGL
jgi:hypothetical protein